MKGFPLRLFLANSGEKKADQTCEPFIRKVSRAAYHHYQSKIQTQAFEMNDQMKKEKSTSHNFLSLPQPPASKGSNLTGAGKRSERRKLKVFQSELVPDHIVCRRAELLVRAAYILTGIFSLFDLELIFPR